MAFRKQPWHPMPLDVGGEANNAGFELRIRAAGAPFELIFRTPDYEHGSNQFHETLRNMYAYMNPLIRFPLWVLFMVLLAHMMPSDRQRLAYFVALLGVVLFADALVSIVFAVSVQFSSRVRDILRWHGCEHRMAFLLEKGVFPTMDAMQGAPELTPRCGSVVQTSLLQRKLFLALASWFGLWWLLPWLSARCASLYSNLLQFGTLLGTGPPRFLKILAMPSLAISLLMQWPWCIHDPTNAQIQHAVLAFERFARMDMYPARMRAPNGQVVEGFVGIDRIDDEKDSWTRLDPYEFGR